MTLGNINNFDAVIFHTFGLHMHSDIPDQSQRKPNQRYIMYMMESPLMDYAWYKNFSNFFNWTISYRWEFIDEEWLKIEEEGYLKFSQKTYVGSVVYKIYNNNCLISLSGLHSFGLTYER